MCDLSSIPILESILEGLLTSVIAGFFVLAIQRIRYYVSLKRHFHKARFNTFYKGNPEAIVQEITCTVKKNIIKFEGISIINNNPPFSGEIILNIFNLKTGESYHLHDNIESNGFGKVIIVDNKTIIMEASYTKMSVTETGAIGKLFPQAFVWRKV